MKYSCCCLNQRISQLLLGLCTDIIDDLHVAAKNCRGHPWGYSKSPSFAGLRFNPHFLRLQTQFFMISHETPCETRFNPHVSH